MAFLSGVERAIHYLPGFRDDGVHVCWAQEALRVNLIDVLGTFGPGRYGTRHGCTFQISAAYSAMVRSLENFPELATFQIAFRAQALGSAYRRSTCSCAWT